MNGKRALLLGILVLVMVGCHHVWRFATIALDVKAVLRIIDGSSGGAPPKPGDPPAKYLPSLTHGLDFPERMPDKFAAVLPNVWESSSGVPLSVAEQQAIFEQIKKSLAPDFSTTFLERTRKGWNEIEPPVLKKLPRPHAPIANLSRVREISRFLAALASLDMQAIASNTPERGDDRDVDGATLSSADLCHRAFEYLWSIPLLAYQLEAQDALVTGGNLVTKMVGVVMRGIAADSLVGHGWELTPTREMVLVSLRRLELLENNKVPIIHTLKMTAHILPAYAEEVRQDINTGHALDKYGWEPHSLVRIFGLDGLWCEAYQIYWQPLIESASGPWIPDSPVFKDFDKRLNDLYTSIFSLSPDYFFRPEQLLLKYGIHITTPSCGKAFTMEIVNWQRLRGAVSALAVHAYIREKNGTPKALTDVEKWLGCKLPDDLFSGRPLEFKAGVPCKLWSNGPDTISGTLDDIPFLLP